MNHGSVFYVEKFLFYYQPTILNLKCHSIGSKISFNFTAKALNSILLFVSDILHTGKFHPHW